MALSLEYDTAMLPTQLSSFKISTRVQLGAGLLLIAALLVKVWLRIEITDYGYELARQRQQMIELDRAERSLHFDLSSLTKRDNLESLARPLGLRPTEPSQVWKVS
jgi:hypothetical protein